MAKAREAMTQPGQLLRFADPSAPAAVHALVAQFGSPLLVLDLAIVRQQYAALSAALPGVTLYYALKPLPDLQVVREIAALGGSFDLATTGEVRLVERAGVPAARCIHTHPVKRECDIVEALDFGVTTFVADRVYESAKKVFRQTVDVSDVVPVFLGQPRIYSTM